MLGINGLVTIANYCREWSDPRLIVVVLNNRDLNMVTWELRALGGSPKIEETQNVPDFSYAQFAKTVELGRMRISKSEEVGPAWDAALGGPPIRHRCRRGCKCARSASACHDGADQELPRGDFQRRPRGGKDRVTVIQAGSRLVVITETSGFGRLLRHLL